MIMEQRLLRPMNKKGVLGLETVKAVMITFLVLAVIGVAVTLALVSLRDSSIFTSGTQEYNDTSSIVGNITSAQTSFFSNTGTIFAILVVVVIILAIAIIIAVVSGFGGAGGIGRKKIFGSGTVMGV